jgi:glycerophosphoryl diester phosphodiesterase
LKHTAIKPQVVDDAHDSGLAVLAWTVNDPARASRLVEWGVDTVITDAVDVIGPATAT